MVPEYVTRSVLSLSYAAVLPTVEFRQSADVHDMVETLYSGTKLGVCTRYTLVVIQIQEF